MAQCSKTPGNGKGALGSRTSPRSGRLLDWDGWVEEGVLSSHFLEKPPSSERELVGRWLSCSTGLSGGV